MVLVKYDSDGETLGRSFSSFPYLYARFEQNSESAKQTNLCRGGTAHVTGFKTVKCR